GVSRSAKVSRTSGTRVYPLAASWLNSDSVMTTPHELVKQEKRKTGLRDSERLRAPVAPAAVVQQADPSCFQSSAGHERNAAISPEASMRSPTIASQSSSRISSAR